METKDIERLKQIDEVLNDKKYKNNFKLFPEFGEIAKMIAIDFDVENMPEILRHTKIRAFSTGSQTDAIAENDEGEIDTIALGLSYSVINKKLNKPYDERTIFINQYYDERDRFDFSDFASLYGYNKVAKQRKKDKANFVENDDAENVKDPQNEQSLTKQKANIFPKERIEEITSGNKILEHKLFNTVTQKELVQYKKKNKNIAKMSLQKQVDLFYRPQVRLKDEEIKQELKNFFDQAFEGKNISETEIPEIDLYEQRATLCHEFLHGLTKRRGFMWGGINTRSKYYLHEGMTEWLTMQTIQKHPDIFFKEKDHSGEVFKPYLAFVCYAEMMEQVFPGCVQDVYFNGKEAIEKYKINDFNLHKMIDDFSVIQQINDPDDFAESGETQHLAKKLETVLSSQAERVKTLAKKKSIPQERCEKYLQSVQGCYDALMANSSTYTPHNFQGGQENAEIGLARNC